MQTIPAVGMSARFVTAGPMGELVGFTSQDRRTLAQTSPVQKRTDWLGLLGYGEPVPTSDTSSANVPGHRKLEYHFRLAEPIWGQLDLPVTIPLQIVSLSPTSTYILTPDRTMV